MIVDYYIFLSTDILKGQLQDLPILQDNAEKTNEIILTEFSVQICIFGLHGASVASVVGKKTISGVDFIMMFEC